MPVRTSPRAPARPARAASVRPFASSRPAPPTAGRQQSFDDLGTPLRHVKFCVVDLETTGTSPRMCAITEVGAAKYVGGQCVGTFQTLVNPGVPIPPEIIYLTGITENMVGPAPRIDGILPSLLEFIGDAVIVGHNVRFDLGFLNAALTARSYPKLANQFVDTCRLARRLVRAEVPNCKLGTLSRHFGFGNQPTHRALDDVRATADLLHLLLERAAGFGVLGLDDLFELPAINRHPQAHKLHLTNHLPRCPGVYLFRDSNGAIVYIGKATNLRARVRSYFSSDDRRKVLPMLQVTNRIDFVTCTTPIEAAVLEIRLIQRELPRFNRQAKFWTNYAYIRINKSSARIPSIVATRDPIGSKASRFVGPFPSLTAARIGVVALREAAEAHGDGWEFALDHAPHALLAPLERRMRALAAEERFEEAAAQRDRAGVLARAVDRQRRAVALRMAGWTEIDVDGRALRIDFGRIRFTDARTAEAPDPDAAIPCDVIDELTLLANWLERAGTRVALTSSVGGLAFASSRMPRFDQREARGEDRVVRPGRGGTDSARAKSVGDALELAG